MTVIAFRPRPNREQPSVPEAEGTPIAGAFASPRGHRGTMRGCLRLQRLVIAPRGAFIVGVFTGELREPDGTLIGTGSRRATVPAELEWDHDGLHPVVRAMQLDLMGFDIEVEPFVIEPALAFAHAQRGDRVRSRGARRRARLETV